MADSKNVYQRLLAVQTELVAPRQAGGKFGKARSAEQILEALKPLLKTHGLLLNTSDVVHDVNGRNYVTTTASVYNVDKPDEYISSDASAWENEVEMSRSGAPILDTSQVTGKTSSYAKKYALQHLFAIDDTRDADHDDPAQANAKAAKQTFPQAEAAYAKGKASSSKVSNDQLAMMNALFTELGITEREDKHIAVSNAIGREIESSTELTKAEASKVIEQLISMKEGQ